MSVEASAMPAWIGRIVIMCNGVAGRVVLAARSRRAEIVTVLGMDGTLLSCGVDDIACVVGGAPGPSFAT
ncbi:hypothetical protein HNP84_006881 [Thermocatellispora tengchongensis]|uniref:Uncharacterized protein n=1 Tax=Thermocatellispora tengchongensis TaxID=1073253 RepID=A0A840PDR3_9ACTN|nr:hypothetical protein [Thermocatellispora tengchongensis]MBB5137129.1 hypothetical protein [Thermocatellispora tengchongensis]